MLFRSAAVGHHIERQTSELSGATDRAAARAAAAGDGLAHQANELAAAAERAAVRAAQAGESFKKQAHQLAQASNDAAAQSDALKQTAASLRGEGFLKAAAFVTDSLNSLAIDLARLLDRNTGDDLWQRYAKGERGVFARRLVRGNETDKIRERYESDGEFRKFADVYLREFDGLLARAREVEHEDLLSTAFLTADVGKLYLLLREALGKAA